MGYTDNFVPFQTNRKKNAKLYIYHTINGLPVSLFVFQIKNTTAATPIPNIAECRAGFQKYFQKIDNLQLVINRINNDLTALEQNVAKAEEELGYNDSGLKGFLKTSIFGKVTRGDDTSGTSDPLSYQPVEIFKASDYFGNGSEQNNEKNT